MDQPQPSPRSTVVNWMPHLFILGLLSMSLVTMCMVIRPLIPVLMMGAALSALTYPVTAGPINLLLERRLPKLQARTRRQISAFATMGVFALMLIIPLIILIWTVTGNISLSQDMVVGMLNKNLGQIDTFLDQMNSKLDRIQELIPALEIDPAWIKAYVGEVLEDVLNLQPALMGFLLKGSGSIVVQILICGLAMIFFYAEGGTISRAVLRTTPLNDGEVDDLTHTFQNVVLRLLCDTIGVSTIKGVALGTIVGLFLDVPIIFLVIIASFICLLPLVGDTLIWLPGATILYQDDRWFSAALLVIFCQLAIRLSNKASKRLGQKLHEHNAITSFFIFMSVIGGMLSLGMKGLVLGPMAVILVMVLGQYWRSYYKQA